VHLFVFSSFGKGFALANLQAMPCGIPAMGTHAAVLPDMQFCSVEVT